MASSLRVTWCAEPNPIVHHHCHHPPQLILAQIAGVCSSWAVAAPAQLHRPTLEEALGTSRSFCWVVQRLQSLRTLCYGQAGGHGRSQLNVGRAPCAAGSSRKVLGTKWHKMGHNMLFVTVLLLIVNQSTLYFKACGHGRELPAKQTA